jgi:hypothetical protein
VLVRHHSDGSAERRAEFTTRRSREAHMRCSGDGQTISTVGT